MRIFRLTIGAIIVFMFGSYSYACGPEFDSAYLVRASKEEFLAIPEGNFLFELSRISGKKVGFDRAISVSLDKGKDSTVDADIKDLENVLTSLSLNKEDKQKALASYAGIRSQILNYLKTNSAENSSLWYGGRFRSHEAKDDSGAATGPYAPKLPENIPKFQTELKFSESIPKEFVLYAQGAISYHNNEFEVAISKWKELLALPKDKRQFKSTWASFMIGKSYLSMRKQKEALPYFDLTRKLASDGFKDSLNLSQESYGWQALAEYELKDYVSCLRNYLSALDVNSLNRVCSKIFELDDSVLEGVIKDDTARKVIIGWVVSRPTKYGKSFWLAPDEEEPSKDIYAKLLKAIEKVQPKGVIENADRIAWIYYTKGDVDKAKKWLKLSKQESALSKFIAVKIMLRDGKINEAIDSLHKLIPLFEKSSEREVFFENDVIREINTDLGVLKLSRKEYLMAFNVLLKGKYWEDIAYVAEKVLTSSELEDYLKQHAKDIEMDNPWELYNGYYIDMQFYFEKRPDVEWQKEWESELRKDTVHQALTYLLARRFARGENWDKAVEYMPTSVEIWWNESKPSGEGYLIWEQKTENINLREKLKTFISLLSKAQDSSLSKQERAKGYYESGLILRKYGMELMGTELDPDGFVSRGGFMCYDALETRFSILTSEAEKDYQEWSKDYIEKLKARRQENEKKRDFFSGSEDEEKRVLASLPEPLRRFHYRYKAADLMWKGAELLPDNDELKAKALCRGGTYLKVRDPKAADKFYKTLVKTCGQTELGKEADKLRWFPKIKE